MFRPFLLLLALMAPALPAAAGEPLPGPVPAQVVEVVDGDTLAVRVRIWLDQELLTRVRLDGIDTPESRSDCEREKQMAREARQALVDLVGREGGQVLLRGVEHDKYGGRVRAAVSLADGTDLARALIQAGHARAYKGGARQPWCAVAERR